MDRTINTAILGDAKDIQRNILNASFSFNGWNLDNGQNIRVIQSNHDDLGNVQFDTYETPLQDGGGVLGKYYRKKTIQLVLSVSGNTEEGLNVLIDEIKYQTSKTEGKLRIIINGVVREWTATCTGLKFNRKNYNVSWVGNVVLTFTCVNPHSHLETPTVENITGQTGTFQSNVMYGGKAETYPKLYIIMDSGTSTGMKFTLNGYTIQIDSSLSQGDIVLFDGETKKVTVNDVEVAYTGPFTPLNYGENTYSIENTGTFTGSLSYFVKFL